MKRFLMIVAIGCALIIPSMSAGAAEIDVLLDKLVEKGVLTPLEAQIVKDDTKEDVARQMSQGRMDTLPSWLQKIKLSGDFRTRYQWQHKASGSSTKVSDRHRGRIRFRLNVAAQINDQIALKAGLVTGSDDPRSGNQTLQKSFDTGDIRLNFAYAEVKPGSWGTFTLGKIANPLWRTSGMLWSGDIMPEGAGMKLKADIIKGVDTFMNAGFFIIDEDRVSGRKYDADPMMWAIQPGAKFKLAKNVNLQTTFNYYGTSGLRGKALAHTSSTNTLSGGLLVYNYDAYGATAELGIKSPFVFEHIPYLGVFGDYIHNPDPDDDNQGWMVGCKVGHQKIKEPGNWQLAYNYRKLEKDAWLDILPDASYYSGATGIKGHQVTLKYGLFKNTSLALNYNNAVNLSGAKRPEDLFQADISFKF